MKLWSHHAFQSHLNAWHDIQAGFGFFFGFAVGLDANWDGSAAFDVLAGLEQVPGLRMGELLDLRAEYGIFVYFRGANLDFEIGEILNLLFRVRNLWEKQFDVFRIVISLVYVFHDDCELVPLSLECGPLLLRQVRDVSDRWQ